MKPGDLLRSKHTPELTVVLLEIQKQDIHAFTDSGVVCGHTCRVIYPDAVIHTVGIYSEHWEVVGGS